MSSADAPAPGAAAALRDPHHLIHRVLALPGMGVVLARQADGRVLAVNDTVAALLGRRSEELLDRTSDELGVYQDPVARERIYAAIAAGKNEWRVELALSRPDGTSVVAMVSATLLDVGGEPCMLGIFEDVSELRRVDAALRASEDELQAAFELSPVGMAVFDLPAKRFRRVNPAMERLTGYSADELTRMRVADFTHPDDVATDDAQAAQLTSGALRNGVFDKRYLCKDGSIRWVQIHFGVLAESAGQPLSGFAVVVDMTERRAAEAERRLLTSALQATANGIVITDVDGRIRWVNEAFSQLTGHGADEAIGQTPSILRSGAQDDGFYQAMWRTIAAGDTWRGELVNRRKDGSLYDEQMTITPVREDGGESITHYIAIKQDVSERKRDDVSRIEAEERFRFALDAAELGTWRLDVATLRFNLDERAREMFGLARADVGIAEMMATIHPADVEMMTRHAAEDGTASAIRRSFEYRIVRPDGQVRWLSTHVRLTYGPDGSRMPRFAFATVRDITDSKRSADALTASEERYRHLIDNLDDLVFTVDLDGRLTFLSPAIRRYGYQPEQVVGHPLQDFVHPADREAMASDIARRLRGEELPPSERRWLGADGRVHYLRASWRPMVRDGELIGFNGLATDVTRQREAEEQLRAAQRMEAVGRMAGGVAHDFNNLLSVITAYTELSMADLAEDDPLRADLNEIATAADRAAGLTRQLLAFSRRQLLTPEPVDLGALVHGLTKMLHRVLGEDIALHVHSDPPLGVTRVDRGQLEQVVMNLAVNARDAMPDGGHLTLATRNLRLDAESACGLELAPGDYVVLEVADTGCGMTPEVRTRMFDPFFTTKPVGKGTGLGLSMVHGIVKQSGGGIDVETAPGRGSTFRIYLPRLVKEEDARSSGHASEKLATEPRGHERILVVEDEGALRSVTRRLLTAAGYQVEVAANAGEALLLCEEHGDQLDLVLTDVVMPGLSGRKLAERLASLCPTAKVMFMSGYNDEMLAHHDVPHDAFIRKPFDRATLAAKVRSVLDGAT